MVKDDVFFPEILLENLPEDTVLFIDDKWNRNHPARCYKIRAEFFCFRRGRQYHGMAAHGVDRKVGSETAHIFVKNAQVQCTVQKFIADFIAVH